VPLLGFLLRFAVRLIGIGRLYRLLDRLRLSRVRRCDIEVEVAALEKRLIAMRLSGWPECFPRAVVAYFVLWMRRVPARLRIGVRRWPFVAHAWVVVG
jgi:hypothetical protein